MENTKNLQKNLYVLVGTPGCGKSTWAEKQMNVMWVSRDAIRFALTSPEEKYFKNEDKVYRMFVSQIQKMLDDNYSVIADATHLDEVSRAKLLRRLKLDNVKLIAVDFKVPENICIERNAKRIGRACVPVPALRRMAKTHTSPKNDKEFIFDEVIEINEKGEVI